jgi:hypothetical protein
MGYVLYREVLEHAPPDVTSGELVVWLVVADDASDKTRLSWIERDELLRRTRMGARGLAHAFGRLAERGYELRVERGKDRNGRPVYAYKGAQSNYRLPVLDLGKADAGVIHLEQERLTQESSIDGQRMTHRSERVTHKSAKGDAQVIPSPQAPQEPQQRAGLAERIVMDATDATADEARAVVALVEQRDRPRSLGGFLRHLAADGDLASRLAAVRDTRQRTDVAAVIDKARQGPECSHRVPGGESLHPVTGRPLCPQCRNAERAAPSDVGAA